MVAIVPQVAEGGWPTVLAEMSRGSGDEIFLVEGELDVCFTKLDSLGGKLVASRLVCFVPGMRAEALN